MLREASYKSIMILAIALLLITSIGAYALTGYFSAIPNTSCTNNSTSTELTPVSVSASSVGVPNWTSGSATSDIFLPRDANGFYENVNNTRSALYNNNITNFSILASKVNNPKGIFTTDIYDNTNTLKSHLGSINASTLTSSRVVHNYPINNIVLEDGDKIGTKYINNATNPKITFTTSMNVTSGVGVITLRNGTSNFNIQGEHVVNTTSALYGKTINAIMVRLNKLGSPTGNIIIGVWDNNANLVYQFGTKDITQLTTAQTNFWFINSTNTYTIAVNDTIGVQYNHGDASNNLVMVTDSANPFDSTFSNRRLWNGVTWNNNNSVDVRIILTKIDNNANSNYALSLDGVNDYVWLPANGLLFPNGTTSLSLKFWIYPQSFKTERIISNYQNSTLGGWELVLSDNNILTFEFFNNTDASHREWTSQIQLQKNQWHYVAMATNGTQTSFYIDEQLDDRPNIEKIQPIKVNTNQIIRLGSSQSSGVSFKGYIDDFEMWTRRITESEAMGMYNGIQASNTNLLLNYTFNEGKGNLVTDSSGNSLHAEIENGGSFVASSIPNFVKIGITDSQQFDNTNTIIDTMHGDKHTWMYDWDSSKGGNSLNTNSILNRTVVDKLINRGIDSIYLGGINTTNVHITKFDRLVKPFTDYVHSKGLKIYAVSFENDKYLNATEWSDTDIRNEVDSIVNIAKPYFDGWSIDIEPENRPDWSTNKSYYLHRYVNISKIIGQEMHSLGVSYADTIAVFHDNNFVTIANITNGFDSLTESDYIIVMTYRSNVTNYQAGVDSIIDRSIKQIHLVNTRTSAGNTGKMTAYQFALAQKAGSIYNDTYSNYLGTGDYQWVYFILKGQTMYEKYTTNLYLNNTNQYDNIFEQRYDLAFNITQAVRNDNADNAIDDDANTFWRSNTYGNNNDGQYIYVKLNQTYLIDKVNLFTYSASAIPEILNIYVSNSNASWGVPVYQGSIDRISGNQTINLVNKVGQYVKLLVSDNGNDNLYNGFSIAEIKPIVMAVTETCIAESHEGEQALLLLIPACGIGAMSILILRKEGVI